MRTATIGIGGLALLCAALAGCTGSGGDPWADRPGPKVLAFFPPIYSLAASVAGDDAQVLPLLTTRGPHDYEPRPADARKLRRADLFLVNGLGLDDPIAAKLADTCGNPNLQTVKLAERVPESCLFAAGLCSCGHDHSEGGDHSGHEHGAHDPHVWLGIPEAITLAEGVCDELAKIDPAHAAGYRQRTAALADRLRKLQEEGKARLAAKTEKARLLTNHDALRYFARTFGAEVVDAIELPGREPSGKRLRELVALCQEKGVRLIAVEPQYPTNTGAQTILHELHRKGIPDAAFVEIDTLETADPQDLTADFYERKMRQNLDALAGALK